VTTDGLLVSPSMTIPQNVLSINVSQTGLVTAMVAGQTAPQQIGQITLANFANDAGLQPLGGNLYAQTEASGQSVTGLPGDPGFGSISQGYLESSNVDPVKEITDLISAQRAYEMNSKVIQAASEMSATL
jgi:flagellar basal-body rod protein FlgG